jgi:hypothetical protein
MHRILVIVQIYILRVRSDIQPKPQMLNKNSNLLNNLIYISKKEIINNMKILDIFLIQYKIKAWS